MQLKQHGFAPVYWPKHRFCRIWCKKITQAFSIICRIFCFFQDFLKKSWNLQIFRTCYRKMQKFHVLQKVPKTTQNWPFFNTKNSRPYISSCWFYIGIGCFILHSGRIMTEQCFIFLISLKAIYLVLCLVEDNPLSPGKHSTLSWKIVMGAPRGPEKDISRQLKVIEKGVVKMKLTTEKGGFIHPMFSKSGAWNEHDQKAYQMS